MHNKPKLVMSNFDSLNNDKYSAHRIMLTGLDQLDDDDTDYIKNVIKKGDHVYVRFNYENNKYEVMRHNNIIGMLPENLIDNKEDFFYRLGYVEVCHKSISPKKKSIEVLLYLKDPNGILPLPSPSVNEREIAVIETEYWKEVWNSDWSLIPFTDELVYRFPELYGSNKLLDEIETDVDLQFNSFIGSFLKGELITEDDVEKKIMDSPSFEVIIENKKKREFAKKILWHRIKSYMSHKCYTFLESRKYIDGVNRENTCNEKKYEPHFRLSYIDSEGKNISKIINHNNLDISIVGMRYRENYEQLLEQIREDVSLIIRVDKDNKYDSTALGFYLEDGNLVAMYLKRISHSLNCSLPVGSLEQQYPTPKMVMSIALFL